MYPIAILKERLSGFDHTCDAPMRAHTTFGLGGPADILVRPRSAEEMLFAAAAAAELEIPVFCMGNGSNLLVRDGGVRGMVLQLGPAMSHIRIQGQTMTCGAGISLHTLSREALGAGLMGLEWSGGIPGTLGGACAMNAGAYGGCMQQTLRRVRYIEGGALHWQTVRPDEMGYRESAYAAPRRFVVEAELFLQKDDGGAQERQASYTRSRKEKQPLAYKSAGSVFKRPPGHFAGALIENAGLKGARMGGAVVSELHAGFILNDGTATAADVLRLIAHIQERVYALFGVSLVCELEIWGEDA